MNQLPVPDKDLPLREDIRLLGRILGDTVRSAKARQCSRSSSRFARLRSASIVTRTRARGANSRRGSTACRPARPTRSFAPSATSPTSPTSPRTSTTSARRRAHALRPLGATRRDHGLRARRAPAGRHRPAALRSLLRRGRDLPGAHRPSDRGAAQEHASTARSRSRSSSPSATACGSRPRRRRRARRRCVAPCSPCGRPASCAATG